MENPDMMMLWWMMKKEAFFEDGRDQNSYHSIHSSLCIRSDKVKQANSSDHWHTFLQCSISHQG